MLSLFMFLYGCSSEKKSTQSENIHQITNVDADGDGYLAEEDCDDSDPQINEGASEICDGIDNNCDGSVDEGVTETFFVDADGDGYGNTNITIESCEPLDGYVAVANDCDDSNPQKYPGSTTLCDEAYTTFCTSGGRFSGNSFQGSFCLTPTNSISGFSAEGSSFTWNPISITLLSENSED